MANVSKLIFGAAIAAVSIASPASAFFEQIAQPGNREIISPVGRSSLVSLSETVEITSAARRRANRAAKAR